MERTITNPFVKDKVVFVRTSAESSGAHTEVEVYLAPGGGTPLHYHNNFSETFTACKGKLGIQLSKGRKLYLSEGEVITVPPKAIHKFFNDTDDEIVFRVVLNPGSIGFERSLRITYGLANDGLTNHKSIPKSLYHLAVVAKIGDGNLVGPLSLITPLINLLYKNAKRKGIENELVKKYCSAH
ncbi:MAG: cupin domain-containing protein [Flavitalea sp.]